jgi:hypothetical protein
MNDTDKVALMEHTTEMARTQFGAFATYDDEHDVVLIPAMGHPYPVVVFANECGPWPLLEMNVAVADNIDWATQGIGEFLLAENQRLFFGRVQRTDYGLEMAHLLFADAPPAQFATVVAALANTAAHLAGHLQRLGALTYPDAA